MMSQIVLRDSGVAKLANDANLLSFESWVMKIHEQSTCYMMVSQIFLRDLGVAKLAKDANLLSFESWVMKIHEQSICYMLMSAVTRTGLRSS